MPKARSRVQKKAKDKSAKYTVNGSTLIAELIERYPRTERVLAEYGLHCVGCAWNGAETLEEGVLAHGYDHEDVRGIIADIHEMIEGKQKSKDLVVTESGARAIADIAEREGKAAHALEVIADEQGGFCLEFRNEPDNDHRTFSHPRVPTVRIVASLGTLERIGGATIDFRDGRFKLDLDNDPAPCPCGGACDCG